MKELMKQFYIIKSYSWNEYLNHNLETTLDELGTCHLADGIMIKFQI